MVEYMNYAELLSFVRFFDKHHPHNDKDICKIYLIEMSKQNGDPRKGGNPFRLYEIESDVYGDFIYYMKTNKVPPLEGQKEFEFAVTDTYMNILFRNRGEKGVISLFAVGLDKDSLIDSVIERIKEIKKPVEEFESIRQKLEALRA